MKDDLHSATVQESEPGVFHLAHERLEVYRVELSFVAWVTDLLREVEVSGAKRLRAVLDQLDRASLSMLLNTAEGNGKRQRPICAKFFDDARGSATECAGCLDALVAKKAVNPARVGAGKRMLAQSIAMLSRLIEIFKDSDGFRENGVPYSRTGFEPLNERSHDKEKKEEKEKD